jgi:integrase/recombinase XerD
LRHRSRATTMIYAKLDTDGLRSIAQPWPTAEAAR